MYYHMHRFYNFKIQIVIIRVVDVVLFVCLSLSRWQSNKLLRWNDTHILVTDCGQLCSPDNNDCLANRRRRRTRRESVMSNNKNKLTPPPRRPSWLDISLPIPHQMTPPQIHAIAQYSPRVLSAATTVLPARARR